MMISEGITPSFRKTTRAVKSNLGGHNRAFFPPMFLAPLVLSAIFSLLFQQQKQTCNVVCSGEASTSGESPRSFSGDLSAYEFQ